MVRVFSSKLCRLLCLTIAFVLFPAFLSFANVTNVETAVYNYLDSLVDGDVAAINRLLDGSLKQRTVGAFRNPDRYGKFLRKQYDQVYMTVVSIDPVADGYYVTVQFDYPYGNTSSFVLEVSNINGLWKITDEIKKGSP